VPGCINSEAGGNMPWASNLVAEIFRSFGFEMKRIERIELNFKGQFLESVIFTNYLEHNEF